MAAIEHHITTFDQIISTCRALSWSDDNRLSLCTDNGMHILELQCSPYQLDPTFSFYKAFIPPPSESLVLLEFTKKQKDALKHKCKLDDYYHLNLDKSINLAQLDNATFRAFKSTAWSPSGADSVGRCVLAALTFDHRLIIYSSQKSHAKWVKVMELSDLHCESLKNDETMKFTFPTIQQFVYERAAMEISWSPVLHSGTILAVGMRNGDIVLWKFKFPILSKGDCEIYRVIKAVQSVQVSSLCWYSQVLDYHNTGVLAVGYHNGTHGIYHVKMLTSEEGCDLFTETDMMEVSCMLWTHIQHRPVLLVCKEWYIFVYMFGVKDCSLKLLSQKTVTGEHTFSCTGISSRKDVIFLSSAEGVLQKMEMRVQNKDIHVQFTKLPVPVDASYDWTFSGLSVSKSGYFLCVIAMPSSFFDHLKYKHPTKMFVSIIDKNQDLKQRLEGDITTEKVRLHNIMESLEVFRQYLCIGENLLPSVTDYISREDQWSSLSIKSLGLIRYFLLTIKQHIPKDSETEMEEQNLTDSNISKICDTLRLLHIRSCIEKVRKMKHLEVTEKLVIARMCYWVEQRPTSVVGSKLNAHIKELKRNFSIVCDAESCQICGGVLTEDNLVVTCSRGHLFGMCCQTFITCQNAPYRKCTVCKALAVDLTMLADISWIPDQFYCMLCGGLLL